MYFSFNNLVFRNQISWGNANTKLFNNLSSCPFNLASYSLPSQPCAPCPLPFVLFPIRRQPGSGHPGKQRGAGQVGVSKYHVFLCREGHSPSLSREKQKKVAENLSRGAGYRSDQGEIWNGQATKQARMSIHSENGAMADFFDGQKDRLADYLKVFLFDLVRAGVCIMSLVENGTQAGQMGHRGRQTGVHKGLKRFA